MNLSKRTRRILIFLFFLGVCFIALHLYIFSADQAKTNRAGTHQAKLFRHDGFDVNFRVQIDGENVYYSPDFAPVEYDFREQMIWDKTGHILVLEVAGKRIFAFDASQKRQLSNSELMTVEYVPFSEFHFEGELPEVNSN